LEENSLDAQVQFFGMIEELHILLGQNTTEAGM
jgi:hypothetical protein